MFIEKQKLQQDLTTESTTMSETTKQTKVVTIKELYELDRKEMSSFSIQLCGKVVSGIDGKLSNSKLYIHLFQLHHYSMQNKKK